MDIIALSICVVLFLVSMVMLENKPLHPATLLYGLYSVILFFSVLNLFGIYKPSDEAYFLIIIMLCSFGLGSLVSNFTGIHVHLRNTSRKKKKYLLNIKLYKLLTGIAIAFLLYDIIMASRYIFNGIPAWQVRNWTLEEFGSNNPILSRRSFIEELIRTVILSPVGMIIPPISAYTFFDPCYKKSKKVIVILSFIQVLMTCIAGGGGRLRMVYFGGCFAIAYLLFSNNKLYHNFKKSRYRKYIVVVGAIAFMVVVLMTWLRLGVGYLWQQIYTYFALPPTLLSIWLPSIKDAAPTYGMLSFYGFVGYFFRALKMFGLNYLVPQTYENAYKYILDAQKFKNTGYGMGNAFVTPIYYIILDGGRTFLVFMSIFFGVITSKIHKGVRTKADIRRFSFYAIMMYGVFESFMTVMTAVPPQIISIVFIFFVCGKVTDE